MNVPLNIERSPDAFVTKAEMARRHIRKMILSGEVKPGDRITTREVSTALNISETPIREAIQGLAADGWLSVQNHVGAVVQGLRIEEVTEISALRGAICALAIELGAPSYDDALLDTIDRNIDAQAKAFDEGDFERFADLNYAFHNLLCDRPDTPYSNRLINNMLGLMSSQRHGISPNAERLVEALKEHRQIRDLLRARDFKGAAEMAKQHEVNAGAYVIKKLSAPVSGNPPGRR